MTLVAPLEQQTPVARKVAELEHYVGQTPLIPIRNLFHKKNVEVYAKVEWQQFGGSVKARPAYAIIREAVQAGLLGQGQVLLDATSGNTGIAYAIFCALSGIPLTLCVPENATGERKHILQSLKAHVIYTSPFETTDGAQIVARELSESNPGKYYYADQYNNENNWRAHFDTTAPEIWEQTDGRVTHFVCGLGTTGTFTGTGRKLKQLNPNVQLIGLQPETALHGLEGWKHLETCRVPGIYDDQLADSFQEIDTLDAYEMIRAAAKHEGLLLSPSAAANLFGAIRLAETLDEGVVVTVLPDNSDKYADVVRPLLNN